MAYNQPPPGYNPGYPQQQPVYPQAYPQQQPMPYGGGQPMYGGPPQQVMAPPMMMPVQPVPNVIPTQSYATLAFLGSVPGLLIRQRTDWIGAVLEVAAHANRYQVRTEKSRVP